MSLVDSVAGCLARGRMDRLAASKGPLIVMYHGLGGDDGVGEEAFGRQLDALVQRRTVVPLREAIEALGRQEAERLAAISFDDGYRDFAEIAMPALAARGLHATLFVPAGKMGGHNDWDAGVLARREILEAGALRRLDPAFVEIGAHGFSHCRMAGLADADLDRETGRAKRDLEDALGRDVPLFAYPYGQREDFDDRAERAVATAGFAAACSTRFGRGSRTSERYRLRRVGIESRDSLTVVERKLDGIYDFVATKEALGTTLRSVARRIRS